MGQHTDVSRVHVADVTSHHVTVGAGLVVDQRVLRRRSSHSYDGRRVICVDPDWLLVQRDVHTRGDFVSVIVDMHGALHCSCADGLRHHPCDHLVPAATSGLRRSLARSKERA